ncbi:MAG: radical SAM protein [Planctomycetes bacterium]|nr:radical SAM protein [Planctomycetota bacterium]
MAGRWDRLKELNRKLSALGALLEDETISSMPEWVQFQTTYVCNLECPHCSTHGTEERRREYNYERKGMDRELLSDVAAKSLPAADEVTLSVSGEPLATPGLEKLLDEFEPYGAKLNLVTNGTTLSPQRLSYLIPIAGHIKVSLDGATPTVLETTRKGARWTSVLQKVRLLMRTIELLPAGFERPRVQISAVAMASNLRELPWLIRLAKVLGIKTVGVAPIIVHFDHLADEVLDKHQAFYNACREEAVEVARVLNVHLFLPPAFSDVQPDPTAVPRGGKLMIPDLPDDYYETVPPLDSAFDAEEIEEQARRTVQMITARLSKDDSRGAQAIDHAAAVEALAEAKVESVLASNSERLARMDEESGEEVKYCAFLHRRAYVSETGVVTPCCTLGRPTLGKIGEDGDLAQIWNGGDYTEFRRRFYSDDPVDCCKGCWYARYIPRRRLLDRVFGVTAAGEV